MRGNMSNDDQHGSDRPPGDGPPQPGYEPPQPGYGPRPATGPRRRDTGHRRVTGSRPPGRIPRRREEEVVPDLVVHHDHRAAGARRAGQRCAVPVRPRLVFGVGGSRRPARLQRLISDPTHDGTVGDQRHTVGVADTRSRATSRCPRHRGLRRRRQRRNRHPQRSTSHHHAGEHHRHTAAERFLPRDRRHDRRHCRLGDRRAVLVAGPVRRRSHLRCEPVRLD